jgi:Raf kinase inhibitor-like YbhB/YbcL family protein
MNISSPDFANGQDIPPRFTCDGENVNPELDIEDAPAEAAGLALVFDDPDSPGGTANPGWVHWLVFNIDPKTTTIARGETPAGTLIGINDWNKAEWGGPCPGSGAHRYFFTLFALDQKFEPGHPPTKAEFTDWAGGRILAKAQLMGKYARSK